RKIPVWVYAFDLLHFDGYDKRQLPLRNRKELLQKALDFKDPLRFIEHRETAGEAYYREACSKGWEGIIAKNGDSVYVSARSREWLKFKCTKEQEFVIGGATQPTEEESWFSAWPVESLYSGEVAVSGDWWTGVRQEA